MRMQNSEIIAHIKVSMRGSRTLCQSGSNFDNDFLVGEVREDPITTISWPSSAPGGGL